MQHRHLRCLPETVVLCVALLAWLGLINVAGYILASADKRRARRGQRRVRERTLLLAALMGGGIGGGLALLHHRHKTRKPRFLVPFWLATAGGAVLDGAALATC